MTTKHAFATYVITEPCVDVKDGTCVEVCPVDCIETASSEPQYYINPDLCIACEQCVLVCPVDAIFLENEVPEKWRGYVEKNAAFFQQAAAAVPPVGNEEAEALLTGARQRALELGLSVSIAVLDKQGQLVGQESVGAPDAERQVRAQNKAYTSVMLERATLHVNERMVRGALSSADQGRMVLEAGGLPFGRPYIVGAIGVAGGTCDQDQECGLAALASWNRWEAERAAV